MGSCHYFEIVAYMLFPCFSLLFFIILNRSQSLEKLFAIRKVRLHDFEILVKEFFREHNFANTSTGGNFSRTHLTRVFRKILKVFVFSRKIYFFENTLCNSFENCCLMRLRKPFIAGNFFEITYEEKFSQSHIFEYLRKYFKRVCS